MLSCSPALARNANVLRLDEAGFLWVVSVACDRPVLDSLHRLFDSKERNEEPFGRYYRISKPVLHFYVQSSGPEYSVNQIFKPRAVDVEQFVFSDDLDVRH